jgi:hypothetical protein
MDKSFTYQFTNPAYPEQTANPEVKADFDNINKTIVSMQIGAGYDIPLSTDNNKTQFVLSLSFLSNLILVKILVQQKHGISLL